MLKKNIGKVTEKGIAKIVSQRGKQLERVTTIILKKAIEKLHKTSFRRLGKLSRKKNICIQKIEHY